MKKVIAIIVAISMMILSSCSTQKQETQTSTVETTQNNNDVFVETETTTEKEDDTTETTTKKQETPTNRIETSKHTETTQQQIVETTTKKIETIKPKPVKITMALYDKNNVLYEDSNLEGHGQIWYKTSETANNNEGVMNIIYAVIDSRNKVVANFYNLHYSLDGNYDSIKGSIFLTQKCKSAKAKGYFEAYGDGKLIFTSPTVTAGVLPQNFSFNVKNVKDLVLKFYGGGDMSGWATVEYGVANLTAEGWK